MKKQKNRGFSLIEIIVVMSIISILIGIVTTNLLSNKQKASINTSTTLLVTDITQQQLKAMLGETEVAGITNKGIYFEPTRYTLFKGDQYSATDSSNFVVTLDDSQQFADITFPNSTLLFASMSGEVINFATATSTIGFKNTVSNEQKTLQINRYGVITRIQ